MIFTFIINFYIRIHDVSNTNVHNIKSHFFQINKTLLYSANSMNKIQFFLHMKSKNTVDNLKLLKNNCSYHK